mgnify:FL=1
MVEADKTEFKAFHESVVDAINGVESDEPRRFPRLSQIASIIKSTKIPKNHDKIISAWEAQMKRFRLNDDLGVVESILSQKKSAEEAALKKAKEARPEDDSGD